MAFRRDSGSGDASVVELSARRIVKPVCPLAQIEKHWEAVRAGRLLPERADIDPRQMAGALENAFVLERLATGLARFRLAGSHINDLIGLEVRGMPLSSLFTPDGRRLLSDAIRAVFDEPATVRMLLESPSEHGRPDLRGEMILLPLRSDLGDVTRILGGLVMHGDAGRKPRRLSIAGQTRQTLVGHAKPQRPAPMQASTPRPPAPVRGHLTLIVDNA